MKKRNAIISVVNPLDNFKLKQLALYFDTIYLNHDYGELLNTNGLPSGNSFNYTKISQDINDIEYLIRKGIISIYTKSKSLQPKDSDELVLFNEGKVLYEAVSEMYSKADPTTASYDKEIQAFASVLSDVETKLGLIHLQQNGIRDIHPIYYLGLSKVNSLRSNTVINFALKQFPVPSDEIAWEQIHDFRADNEIQDNYSSLIVWINELAASGKSLSNIEDEFEYYYRRFTKSYERHNVKSNTATVIMLLSFTAGVSTGIPIPAAIAITVLAEQLANLSEWFKERIGAKIDEFDLPGNEVAYIYKANQKF